MVYGNDDSYDASGRREENIKSIIQRTTTAVPTSTKKTNAFRRSQPTLRGPGFLHPLYPTQETQEKYLRRDARLPGGRPRGNRLNMRVVVCPLQINY